MYCTYNVALLRRPYFIQFASRGGFQFSVFLTTYTTRCLSMKKFLKLTCSFSMNFVTVYSLAFTSYIVNIKSNDASKAASKNIGQARRKDSLCLVGSKYNAGSAWIEEKRIRFECRHHIKSITK